MQSNGREIQIPVFFLRARYTVNSVVKDLIRTFLSLSKLEYLDVLFRENDPYKREITCQTMKVYILNTNLFISQRTHSPSLQIK